MIQMLESKNRRGNESSKAKCLSRHRGFTRLGQSHEHRVGDRGRVGEGGRGDGSPFRKDSRPPFLPGPRRCFPQERSINRAEYSTPPHSSSDSQDGDTHGKSGCPATCTGKTPRLLPRPSTPLPDCCRLLPPRCGLPEPL